MSAAGKYCRLRAVRNKLCDHDSRRIIGKPCRQCLALIGEHRVLADENLGSGITGHTGFYAVDQRGGPHQ